jgi:CRISPR-associated protein Csx10
MKTVYYHVTLKEPAILTAIDGEPNSAVSYDFIPGGVMRGFFIGEAMRQYNLHEIDPTDEAPCRLFFSNQTRYLNLYPVINGRRSLPVPASWRVKKYGSKTTVYDEAVGHHESHDKMSSSKGFVDYPEQEKTGIYQPARILNVHTQRARRSPDEQQVYRYDALAPGQTFAGMILCQSDEDANMLHGLIQNRHQIHIGGARSAGYGLAEMGDAVIHDEWWEVPHQPATTTILTLLSDVILRDALGQYNPTVDALRQAFNRYGIDFEYHDKDYIAMQTIQVGGFNRKWGLPLPQTPALKRGSVITLANVQYHEDDLWALVRDGLGERTNEGFGQIALNWQRDAEIQIEHPKKPQVQLEELAETEDGSAIWTAFEARISKKRLDPQNIQTLFADVQYKIVGDISPSQLSRLRAKIADELREEPPSMDFLRQFLDDISGKKDAERTGKNPKLKAAGKQFDRARINGKSLLEWLRDPQFNFAGDASDDPQYCLRLIDVVLERAYKERTSGQKARA